MLGSQKQISRMLLKSCLYIHRNGIYLALNGKISSVRLTFGCRSSPKISDTLSEALCWILLNNCKLPFVLHLLDDFLLVNYPHVKPDRCISALKCTFNDLGVPISEEKTLGPF